MIVLGIDPGTAVTGYGVVFGGSVPSLIECGVIRTPARAPLAARLKDIFDGVSDTVDVELERKLNMSLAELELSVRATNCLESEGISTVRDLVMRTEDELLEVRNFGETTLREVKSKLVERGLTLGMRLAPARR